MLFHGLVFVSPDSSENPFYKIAVQRKFFKKIATDSGNSF